MTQFSTIDMAEVTRLTRAGKLAEAVAMLQGRSVPRTANDAPAQGPGRPAWSSERPSPTSSPTSSRTSSRTLWPTIDMVPPAGPEGAWTAPREAEERNADAPAGGDRPARFPDLSEAMRAVRDRLGQPGAFGPAEGLGAVRPRAVPVPEGARFEERSFANAAGSRTYKVFVPSGYSGQPLPVVVMLHGCTQNPDDFALGTRMNDLAEEHTFLVAYPRQPQSANMQKCWNWFNAADQARDGGEPALIAGIATAVVEEFSADPSRVYVAGLSAGGAAAAIMAATYPDLFAAVGVHSGLACGAARDMPSAFAAMNGGAAVQPRRGGPAVPTIVFHGDGDRTVNPVNGDQVIAQAKPAGTLVAAVTRGESPGGIAYTRTVHADETGRAVLEQWLLHGAGHAWSGGSADGSYTDPRGPDASRELMRFFLAHARAPSPSRH
ncbi:extracellular catalytic domain type 1 short-chain-length polyhydroxyalkanoate depolymerase [Methylobacterium sp. WSM2598]|uniref:extracellular catalytic domain type 1 short-chain-length polyhydroxyalkanoate depolymerase n=1 Tax=Methylobacterium sp. WSM2598 TaxID=398261 RepID=UPI0003806BDA|nr:PHB depolymerase family esterase [Methylobacterium sp. WSM2598]